MVEEMEYNAKILVKVSYAWIVLDYKEQSNLGPGVALQSPTFYGPKGHSFKIILYPRGDTELSYIDGRVSLAIETTQTAELVLGFTIVNRFLGVSRFIAYSPKRSSFDKRGMFRRVHTVEAGHRSPSIQFPKHEMESDGKPSSFRRIKATIGVFINTTVKQPPPIDRILFIRVQNVRFYVEQSLLEKRCPALLPKHSSSTADADADIVISHFEPDLIDALLWFIYNKKLHYRDVENMSRYNPRDPNSFSRWINAAAHHYELPHLIKICNPPTTCGGCLHEMCLCIPIGCFHLFMKSWNTARRITDKSIRLHYNEVTKIWLPQKPRYTIVEGGPGVAKGEIVANSVKAVLNGEEENAAAGA